MKYFIYFLLFNLMLCGGLAIFEASRGNWGWVYFDLFFCFVNYINLRRACYIYDERQKK